MAFSLFKYEQRGWEKFFTVKQRGISLLVINFTSIIYHELDYSTIIVLAISQYCHNLRMNTGTNEYMYREGKGVIILTQTIGLWLIVLFIIISFILNLFGLLNIFPLIITAPLLFLSLLSLVLFLNERKRFKGL